MGHDVRAKAYLGYKVWVTEEITRDNYDSIHDKLLQLLKSFSHWELSCLRHQMSCDEPEENSYTFIVHRTGNECGSGFGLGNSESDSTFEEKYIENKDPTEDLETLEKLLGLDISKTQKLYLEISHY